MFLTNVKINIPENHMFLNPMNKIYQKLRSKFFRSDEKSEITFEKYFDNQLIDFISLETQPDFY